MIRNSGSCFAALWKVGLGHKNKKERMSDSNMIMMPSELMIKKTKPLLFWLLLLALLSWSIMSQSRSLLVSSACQVDYIFLMPSQAISKMMLHKTIWTDTFHVAGGDMIKIHPKVRF